MVKQTIKITNPSGLHARPAAMFVQTAGKFTSNICIQKGEKQVDAKSIMGLMSLSVAKGEEVEIRAEGEDEKTAVSELIDLTKSGFGELD